MEVLQLLLHQFPAASETEITWLNEVYTHIKEQVCPTFPGPAIFVKESFGSQRENVYDDSNLQVDKHAFHLTLNMVKKMQELKCSTNAISINYRLVSATELLSRQRLACVSNLSWSTNQQRDWVKEAELHLSGQQALPRVNLLLVGCMRTGVNGDWMFTDRSGSVRCECPCPSPLWWNLPVFLPHWNYIPYNSEDRDAAGGFLELVASPVLLSDCPSNGSVSAPSTGFEPERAISIQEASGIRCNRTRRQHMSLFGKVSSVSPLLVIAGTSFFCFSLTNDTQTLPVIVKETCKLWWNQCVCVGDDICLTALRVVTLRAWRRNSLFCVTEHSEMIYNHMQERKHHGHDYIQSNPQSDSALSLMSASNHGPKPGKQVVQSTVTVKQSRLISYQGTVTNVVSEGAGLYVIDNKVGLCLAYQPSLRRNLRSGDVVEIHNVHFLYCPCPDFPPIMLCTCLRSTLRVKTFSRVMASQADCTCPGDGVLPMLLLENNIGVSEYLWTCHLSSQLKRSLVKQQHCVCQLSWKLMEYLLRSGQLKQRDIYSEMLDQPHSCPLNQYNTDHAVHQPISVSELTESLQSECWSSLCLRSQLISAGSSLVGARSTRIQINGALSWSHRILTSDVRKSAQHEGALRQRPLLVIGLLELPSQSGGLTLSLRDGTGTIACVLTEAGEEGQRAVSNTAWIGCLVCVHQFNMVMERFLQSDFPSDQHLEQDTFIKHRHCRVYLQFSLDHVYILSPSVAMVTHLQHRDIAIETKGQLDFPHPVTTTTCHSLVIRVDQKEGVTWKNMREESNEEEARLTSCFSVRVTVIGPVVSWEQDPKNCQMTDKEVGIEKKATLVCLGVSSCWFPLLQPGFNYRLVARNTQSFTILAGVSDNDSTLQVQPEWRFYTLTQALLLYNFQQISSSHILTVSEVLESSLEMVCFRGLVSERISLNDRTVDKIRTYSGMRLTMFDQSGKSLRVYVDLTNTPYPLGLLPGNTLLLSGFQRRLSKSGSVYCSYLPVSCITVVKLGNNSSAQPPPATMMLIRQLALRKDRDCVGRVKGHVVCCLSLHLYWSCSECGDIYTTATANCQCLTTTALFNSKAKLVIEDGTGDARVWFSGQQVQSLLGLADSQWEGLQRALRARGHIRVFPQGRNVISTKGDTLYHFLDWLCSSKVVCRLVTLTCRKFSNQTSRQDEMKLFSRGDRNFMTRMTLPLQLACVHLQELI